jgi:capsular polysaccharide transport system permease protein
MEVLPISRNDSGREGPAGMDLPQLTGKRFPRPDRLFLLVVVCPVLAAILYFGFLASPVFISESSFIVRNPQKPTPSALGGILESAGFSTGTDEIYAAQSYANSRDALRSLNHNRAVERAYTRPNIFIFERFNPFGFSGSFESLYAYFKDKVSLKNDAATSIETLAVSAFDPRDAQRFNEQLLEMSEHTVNSLNNRGQQDLVRYAEREAAQAKAQAQAAAVALAAYRDESGVVDPEKEAEAQKTMISKLQDELIATKMDLAQLVHFTPENPRIPLVRTQIGTLQHEIDEQLGKVTGNRRSLAQSAVRFERLDLENEFAGKQLTAALASLDQARSDAQRKQAYVERIVEPNLPDAPMQPRRLRDIFATMALSFLAYGILRMLLAGIREHAQ